MSTIKLDSYTLRTRCISRIDDLKGTLRNAKSYLTYNSLPTNFKYRNTLENIIDSIDSCISNLEEIKDYINESNSSFDRILQDVMQESNSLPTKIVSRR